MTNPISRLDSTVLEPVNLEQKTKLLYDLESGQVIFLPKIYYASPLEPLLLTESILGKKHKNISFDYETNRLNGVNNDSEIKNLSEMLLQFMRNYALFAQNLVVSLFPFYEQSLQWGRTSYRPAEIKNRLTSKRKDDTRLHVDSFAATPVNGLRILRVFCNIHPHRMPRIWNIGEPLPKVIDYYAAKIPDYRPWLAMLLQWFKVTKTRRSAYDHYQLQLHDQMKLDDHYQAHAPKVNVEFPSHSSWIVFSDQVSHAALGGQFLLEQTFYIPVSAMQSAELSPLKLWQKKKGFL